MDRETDCQLMWLILRVGGHLVPSTSGAPSILYPVYTIYMPRFQTLVTRLSLTYLCESSCPSWCTSLPWPLVSLTFCLFRRVHLRNVSDLLWISLFITLLFITPSFPWIIIALWNIGISHRVFSWTMNLLPHWNILVRAKCSNCLLFFFSFSFGY